MAPTSRRPEKSHGHWAIAGTELARLSAGVGLLLLFLWLSPYSLFIQGDGDVIFMTLSVPNFFAGHIPRIEVKLAFLHLTRLRLLGILVVAPFQTPQIANGNGSQTA
jgi:hypothetical protein